MHLPQNQADFVHYAERCHWNRLEYTRHNGFSDCEYIIGDLYKLGRDYQVLHMDYDQFERILLGKEDYYRYSRKSSKYPFRGRGSHYCDINWYRVLQGFTYNGQPKKTKSEKQYWREHSGINKDKKKATWSCKWKKSFKNANKRKHRQLERASISNERYDRLHRRTYKQAENPWSWD